MNEELFNEATKSNVLTKKLIDQLLESMSDVQAASGFMSRLMVVSFRDYIDCGQPTPMMAMPLRMTCRTAAASATRASFSAASSTSMRSAL